MRPILADENVHSGIIQGLRKLNYEMFFVPDLGLAGCIDSQILDYAESKELILLTGDKDFGGLAQFGGLWGRGKVILPRYHFLNTGKFVNDIDRILNNEAGLFNSDLPFVASLFENGYRIHKPKPRNL